MTTSEEVDKDISWKLIFAKWLAQQGVPSVLLFAILFVVAYGTHYAFEVAIPQHLQAIQQGYDRMQEAHAKEEARLVETFEKTLNRVETSIHTNTNGTKKENL